LFEIRKQKAEIGESAARADEAGRGVKKRRAKPRPGAARGEDTPRGWDDSVPFCVEQHYVTNVLARHVAPVSPEIHAGDITAASVDLANQLLELSFEKSSQVAFLANIDQNDFVMSTVRRHGLRM